MGNHPAFSFDNLVDGGFLDNFDGKIIKAGFTTGFVPADKAKAQGAQDGQPRTTYQFFILWQPLSAPDGEEAKPQPSWYGMGGREFVFGGKTEEVTIGKEVRTLYETVVDGPPLTKTCRFGMFLQRCMGLGFTPKGGNASSVLGLTAHLKREKYENSGTTSDKEALMPTAILAKPGTTAVVGTAAGAATPAPDTSVEDNEAVIMKMMEGLTDKDVPKLDKADLKEMGLSTAKVYTMLAKLEKAGKFVKDGEGQYHAAAE